MKRRRTSDVLTQVLAGQQSLFSAPPSEPPSFDEMCPPGPEEQLALEVDAAIQARNQTSVYDYDC